MSKVGQHAKRTALISLAVLQIFFYPAFAFADTPSDEQPPITTTEVVAQPSEETTQPVEEPAHPTEESQPQTQPLEVTAAPETEIEPDTPPVSEATDNTVAQDQDTTINSSAHVTNNIPTTAQSGDAAVEGNRVGGNATTGSADGYVNLVNLLQSQSNVLGTGNMLTFTADIQGNVVGDLLLDPGQLSVENNILGSANVRVTNAAGIMNNVDLSAQSGDATVAENRVGGDASTGNANAVLNIVNILNSIISAGGSFFGTINIHGNLDGDILLPPNFLSQVLASNSIPTTSIDVPTEYILDTNLSNHQAIDNNIEVTAASGNAGVRDNRVGGDATGGNATTKVTVLNLTGHQVVAANTMLVFVNVQGEWVGLLMDAPGGSTAAALGGGVVSSGISVEADVDIENNQQIINNARVHAQSGDATVRDNRVGGDATAGDATASANIANMANTQFSLTDWFGILFINVFGTWHGSFGVNTAAGNPTVVGPPPAPGASPAASQPFGFVPGGVSGPAVHFTAPSNSVSPTSPTSDSSTPAATQTLSAATVENTSTNPLQQSSGKEKNEKSASSSNWTYVGLGLLLAAALLAGERLVTLIQQRRV